jgi:hypothetical protein
VPSTKAAARADTQAIALLPPALDYLPCGYAPRCLCVLLLHSTYTACLAPSHHPSATLLPPVFGPPTVPRHARDAAEVWVQLEVGGQAGGATLLQAAGRARGGCVEHGCGGRADEARGCRAGVMG